MLLFAPLSIKTSISTILRIIFLHMFMSHFVSYHFPSVLFSNEVSHVTGDMHIATTILIIENH